MENFTPIPAFTGGILIGISAMLLLLFNGRIAGISGIMGGLMSNRRTELYWRLAFLVGIVMGAFLFHLIKPTPDISRENFPFPLLIIAGVFVGFGTRMGNGCTSGHAICGIARLSPRSLIATLTFMVTGFITVFIVRHWLG